jgi:hypothetical protein
MIRLNTAISHPEILAVLPQIRKGSRKGMIEMALLMFIRSDAGKAYLECHGSEFREGFPPDSQVVQEDRETMRKMILGDFE